MNSYYTFSWGGITFSEPNLFLTDMVMAAAGFYCYVSIQKSSSFNLSGYRKFFLLTAISAIISGFGHLFTFYTGQYMKVFAWIFSLTANFFIVQSSLQYLSQKSVKTLSIFSIVKFAIGLGALLYFMQFIVITIDTVLSIAIISLPIHFRQWKQTNTEGLKWFCGGIVFTMLTAIVGALHLSISDVWFNDKDINHLIICGGMLLMRKGLNRL
jgi:hypothetical protein